MSAKYRESNLDKKLRNWFVKDLTRGLLREIELRKGNLRGLTNFKLKLDYPITAIAGRNGAGKSTLLAMACCAYHNDEFGFKLMNRRLPYYTFSDFFVQHTEEVPPQGIEIWYQFAYDNWRKSDSFPEGKGFGRQKRWKGNGGKWNNYASRVKGNVVFLGIDRIVPHSERSQSKSYSKVFSEAEAHGWESKVTNAVGYILGKKYDDLRYLEYSKYILPIVDCDGLKYSGLNMGAAENALFEIFRIIYSCDSGALLVIDEIELGLHVDAQRKFIGKLKETCLEEKIQVICTTHSREIFERLPPDARKYIECLNGKTVITDAIAPEYAMAKMGATENKELDIYVEDGIAASILALGLSTHLRSRVMTIPIGSASAVSRQLGAAYARSEKRPIFAVFDDDQSSLEADNLKHAQNLAETAGKDFEPWILDRIAYLPGETWPEAWLVQRNLEHLDTLAELVGADSDWLSEVLEYGLQAGKHDEFFEISAHLGLERNQCVQFFVMNLVKNAPEELKSLNEVVLSRLEA